MPKRGKKGMSPTARTLALLRSEGWLVDITERWIAQAGIKRDLYGMFDLLAIRPDPPTILAVQTTSADHHANRRTKLLASPMLPTWLGAGGKVEVISWQLHGGKWVCRREGITLQDAQVATVQITPRRRPRRQRKGERQGELFSDAQ